MPDRPAVAAAAAAAAARHTRARTKGKKEKERRSYTRFCGGRRSLLLLREMRGGSFLDRNGDVI